MDKKIYQFNMQRIAKIEAKLEQAEDNGIDIDKDISFLSPWEQRYYLAHCNREWDKYQAECYAREDWFGDGM